MSRNMTRVPISALDYSRKAESVALEFMIDYDNSKLYARGKDGITFLAFNKAADDHIANADIHVTLTQKTTWEQNFTSLFNSVSSLGTLNAPLNSPALTGTPTAPSAPAFTNSTQIATTEFTQNAIKAGDAHAVDGKHVDDTQVTTGYLWTAYKIKAYVDSLLASNDAMIFKGTIGTGGVVTALPTTDYEAGWSYKVITAGTYNGAVCEVGDLIICVKDYDSGTASAADWIVTQTNLDGAVTGSSTSVTDGHVPIFDGATGKIIKTSGKALPAGNIVGDTSFGTSSVAGVVKSASSNNCVTINADGSMVVNLITVSKGGTAKTTIAANSMLYGASANTYAEVTTSAFGRSLLNAVSGSKFTNLNADMLDDMHLCDCSTSLGPVTWGYVPAVKVDGSIELAKYVDFHATANDGIDYAYRLTAAVGELIGSHKFTAPEIKTTGRFNINDKAAIQYNTTDGCIEFVTLP